ncbi:ribose-5-phosphate isomerase B [alpha proteobacterium HIMB5]|nr:ribose-5-phosphate isomerase B [alpha proteobacterium HIMB5]
MFLIINLTNLKKIYIASDHAGFTLKEFVKKKLSKKIKFDDQGPHSDEISVNYPDFAHKLCKKVSKNSSNMGILICGSGMGMAMAANRHKKIRAALCYSVKNTKLSRLHNNSNVITLGARLINKNTAMKCINTFLKTKFEGGRHLKRVKKI